VTVLTGMLADIRDSDFESAWIYTLIVFGGACLVGWGLWTVVRPLRRMWRSNERTLATVLGLVALGTTVMFGAIVATLAFNFVHIANGPGGTP
jgi:uncharacterized membrane protein YidH (DUF202 family)